MHVSKNNKFKRKKACRKITPAPSSRRCYKAHQVPALPSPGGDELDHVVEGGPEVLVVPAAPQEQLRQHGPPGPRPPLGVVPRGQGLPEGQAEAVQLCEVLRVGAAAHEIGAEGPACVCEEGGDMNILIMDECLRKKNTHLIAE